VAGIARSLVDTSNVLVSVRGRATSIESALESAQNASSAGTGAVAGKVVAANSVLGPAQGDTSAITGQLGLVNQSLDAICTSPLVALVGTLHGQTSCG
jgi:hypothetical protein